MILIKTGLMILVNRILTASDVTGSGAMAEKILL